MKYIITQREVFVRQYIVETDKTKRDDIIQQFYNSDIDSLKQPGGNSYDDHMTDDVEKVTTEDGTEVVDVP